MTTEQEAELERTTRLRGFRYGLHDFLAELDLHALKAVNDHVEADYVNESLLDRRKMFQTCGSATLSESESTINAREGSDDYPSAALPLLPRNRYCQAWDVT